MSAVLSQLLIMSLQGAVLIAAILVLRAAFAGKIAPNIFYALWLLPAARLLVPLRLGSAFSFLNLIPSYVRSAAGAAMHSAHQVVQTAPNTPPAFTGVSDTAGYGALQPAAPGGVYLSIAAAAVLVWLAGAAVLLGAAAWQNIRFTRRVKKNAVELEIECVRKVYLSESISSPCLCGFVHPAIYVDEQTLQSQRALDLALRHELEHDRAGDRFWALLRLVCCAVHWFNPMVWIAAAASVQDCERACDARVLKKADEEERRSYGTLLLSYAAGRRRREVLCVASPMGGGKKALRRRISLVAQKITTHKIAAAVLALCVAAACLVACTSWAGSTGAAYRRLGAMMGQAETVQFMSGADAASGRTLQNYLNSKNWKKLGGDMTAAEGTAVAFYMLEDRFDGNKTLVISKALNSDDYTARVSLPSQGGLRTETAWYHISAEDAYEAWALGQISGGSALRAPLSGGGDYVLVSRNLAMGYVQHYLFKSGNGRDYTLVKSNLSEQYGHAAENMVFISRNVGFVTFGYGETEGLPSPHLYRTANGGKNWKRIELPMGDITTENGCGGIHVSDISFEDGRDGTVTVAYTRGGAVQESSFVTRDGGRSFAAARPD